MHDLLNPYVIGVLLGVVVASVAAVIAASVVFRRLNPCGGMTAGGVCSKRYGHKGGCR